jgi:hypothetical protein
MANVDAVRAIEDEMRPWLCQNQAHGGDKGILWLCQNRVHKDEHGDEALRPSLPFSGMHRGQRQAPVFQYQAGEERDE